MKLKPSAERELIASHHDLTGKLIPRTVRLLPSEDAELYEKAYLFTGGNVSEYMRYAIKHFQVAQKDLLDGLKLEDIVRDAS